MQNVMNIKMYVVLDWNHTQQPNIIYTLHFHYVYNTIFLRALNLNVQG